MQTKKTSDTVDISPWRGPPKPKPSHLWRRLPAAVKVILIAALAMAMLGVEIELCLAPQLDVILTAAGVWAMWAWVAGGISPGR